MNRAALLVRHPVRARSTERTAVRVFASVGLCARAVLYVLLGVVSATVAAGHSSAETDQWGAMQQVNHGVAGHIVLWALAAGLAVYALWRLSEAVLGMPRRGVGDRLKALVAAVLYALLAVTAFDIVLGTPTQSTASRQREFTAEVMGHPGGQVLVGVVGGIVAVVGIAFVVQGLSRRFERDLDVARMSRTTRRLVGAVGSVGTTARGLVFCLVGALVVDAAVTFTSRRAAGLDSALRTLRDAPAGRWVLGVVAAGLFAFGLYSFFEARWRRTG